MDVMQRFLNTVRAARPLLLLALVLTGTMGPLSTTVLGAASVTLAWDANSETNLAGYKLHYGSASGQFPTVVDVGNVLTATVSNLVEGTYFFVATAYDTEGLESDPSNEVSYSVPGSPPTISNIADQTINEDSSTSALPFQVADQETPVNSLRLSASSSNPALVPISSIVFGGSGTNRTVRVTPALNQSGTAILTVTVTDGGGAMASDSFTLAVQAVNDAPVISAIGNQTVAQDTPTPALPFQVTDPETPAASLTLSANSSNLALVPLSGIAFGGSGTNRTVRVTPATNQSGTTVITVTVADANGGTARTSFILTVQAVTNHPPVISAIPDQIVLQGEGVGALPLTIYDQETPAAGLIVRALSSNTNLVPVSNIRLEGTGTNRTITVLPHLNLVGTATVSVVVNDGIFTAQRSFAVSIRSLSEMPRYPLTVLTNGLGTVEPRLSGSNLILGQMYTLVARPGANQLFSGWSGAVVASTNRLRFAMQSNLVLQANFVPDPFLPRRGSYNGLFYETNEVRHESSGFFALRLNPRGAFSANLKLARESIHFTGSFGLDGRVTRTLRRAGTNAVTVELSLDVASAPIRLRGQISDGTWIATLLADRAISDVTTNSDVYSGAYTMSIPGSNEPTGGPEGSGFGCVRVNRKGVVRLYGELADGRPIVQAVPLSAEGCWPLYVPLYLKSGSLLSWITFTNTTTDSLHGLLSWIKPARPLTRYFPNGFTNEASIVGSSFRPVAGTTNCVLELTNALVVLGGGNLSGAFTNAVTLAAPNKVLNAGINTLSARINPASGTLSGSFVDPVTRRIHQFCGVILQQQRLGAGYVSGTNATGFMQLQPSLE
jgi:hypothetical protein